MNLTFFLVSSVLAVLIEASSKPKVGGTANSSVKSRMATKEIAAAQDRKIQAFIERVRNNTNQTGAAPKAKPSAKSKAKKAAKIAKRQAKKAATKKAAAPSAGKQEAGPVQQYQGGEEEDELLSISASVEFNRRRRSISHFSLSESEHYKDCSDTSSSSSTREDGTRRSRPKYGYRLRHCRINAQEQRFRSRSNELSISGSVDLGEIDISGSLSGESRRRRTGRTVLRICEDELARRENKRCCRDRRRRRRSGSRSSSSSSSSDFARVDYRKKVFYHSESERSVSNSLSVSLSVDEDAVALAPH